MWILDLEIVLRIDICLKLMIWADIHTPALHIKLVTLHSTKMVLFGYICRFSYV